MLKKLTVVIPAYNEEKTIGPLLSAITGKLENMGVESQLIVVDDGSTDSTGAIAKEKGAELILLSPNRGYGRAVKRGIKAARNEYIMIADADGTYGVSSIEKLLGMESNYDMLVGARKKIDPSLIKKPAKWLINRLAGYITGVKIPDLNSGLRIFKKREALKFFPILPDGFSLTSTLTIAMLNSGSVVQYREIDYKKRKTRSKFRPFSDTVNLVSFIFQTTIYFNPLKIFVPVSLALFLCAFASLAYRIFYGGLGVVSIIFFLAAVQVLSLGLIADLIGKQLPH